MPGDTTYVPASIRRACVLSILAIASTLSHAQLCFVNSVVSLLENATSAVYAADLNGDGYTDLIAAGRSIDTIVWHENLSGTGFARRIITDQAGSPEAVYAADVDGDGDIDVLSASSHDNTIAWYRSSGGTVPGFTRLVITSSASGANDVFAIDLDDDGDIDVISASSDDHTVAWYENDGSAMPSFTEHVLTTAATGASSVFAADLDNDGDLDVISAAASAFEIAWYENDGAPDPGFMYNVISKTQNRPRDVRADDLDADGDLDIILAATSEDKVVWLENNGAPDPVFSESIVSSDIDGPQAIDVLDLDSDGDLDVICAAITEDVVAWFENDGAPDPSFSKWVIVFDADGALGIDCADFDNNGIPDIVSAWANASTLAMHHGVRVVNENTSELYGTINEAILASVNGQSLLAEEAHFDESCALSINFFGRSLSLRSTGAIERSGLAATTLADGASIESSLKSPLDIKGILDIPPGANALLLGDDVTISGPISLGVNAELVGGPNLVVAGLANLTQREVSLVATGARSVFNADLDADGNLDIIAALEGADQVVWYENLGGSNPGFNSHTIATNVDGATRVYSADIDGDGDLDVISSAFDSNTISWHRNDGGTPLTFTNIVIDNSSMGALSVHAEDIDLDGDVDIFSASQTDDQISWYENNGSASPSFKKIIITDLANGASDVYASDLDGDGDIDLISSAISGSEIAWYENDGFPDPTFTRQVISTTQNRPRDVHAADIDNDGDVDVICASTSEDRIAWFRNDGNTNPVFMEFVISDEIDGPESIDVADIDNDGDLDVSSASISGDLISWYENMGEATPTFTQHVIRTRLDAARSVSIGDIDGDRDNDISLAATSSNSVTWYQNGINSDIAIQSLFSTLRGLDELRLRNKNVYIEQTVELSAGNRLLIDPTSTLLGGGDLVAPTIINTGGLKPNPGGSLNLVGNYEQTYLDPTLGLLSGTILIDLPALPGSTSIAIDGNAALGGGLLISAPPTGFHPSSGQVLAPILTASTLLKDAAMFDVVLTPLIELDDMGETVPGTLLPVYSSPGEPGAVALTAVPLVDLFFSSSQFTIDGTPNDAIIADVSGAADGSPDGTPDLVIAIPRIDVIAPNGAIAVLIGNREMDAFSFESVLLYTGADVDAPVSVDVGDFDNDGIPDIAFANSGENGISNSVRFLFVDTTLPSPIQPSSIPEIAIQPNALVTDLAVGEVLLIGFNRDDLLIAVRDPIQSYLSVSTFNPVFPDWTSCEVDVDDIDTVDVSPSSVVSKGFLIDDVIAISSPLSNSIRVYMVENGDVDNAPFLDYPAGVDPRDLLIALLDADSFPDIVALNRGNEQSQGSLTVLRGGVTSFSPPVNIPLAEQDAIATSPTSLSFADIDNDTDLDIVIIANNETGTRAVRELRNTSEQGGGNGISFSRVTDLNDQPAGPPVLVRAADLDGDSLGIPDDLVLLVDSSALPLGVPSAQSVVQLTAISEPCIADLNNDGELNFFDVSAFLTAYLMSDLIVDFNGDGMLDFFDVSQFLTVYLSGCESSQSGSE